MYPKVSIIILNWNGKEDTLECLESLYQIDYPNYEIILVDNDSNDSSVELFKEKYPEIEIIQNKENLGFAEGNNIGIKKAINSGTEYVLLLNNDTTVSQNFLTELIDAAKDIDVGIAGPMVYFYDYPNKIQSTGHKILWNRGKPSDLRRNKIDNGKLENIENVDCVCGCAFLAKSEVFKKIGYLNKNYFLYWEETELCVRASKAGYNIIFVPKAKIWHKGGTKSKASGLYNYYVNRNAFWFMKQHSTGKQYISFLLYFLAFRFWYLTAVNLLYYKNIHGFMSFLKGCWDGISKSA